ncbi:biotin/lipoyl-containing protein, partial [Streptomyces sp. NPDC000987]|uniref:biotin/lipoyl-containing protein n=2 Tax=unclassified Streptomyces TaxID=2593676 RepID=UPI003331AF48
RTVVRDPAFAPELTGSTGPFTVHTRWIETEFVNDIKPFAAPADTEAEEDAGRETVVVEVGGKRLEVSLPASLGMSLARTGLAAGAKPKRRAAKKSGPVASGDTLASPMQGTIVKVAVEEGQEVKEGDLIVVLEAMKMEQPLNAHKAGTVKGLSAEIGASVTSGAAICEIKD